MQRFKNILLVASSTAEMSETLDRAVQLAQDNQAQLTVVDIRKEPLISKDPTEPSLPPLEPRETTPENGLERLIAPIRAKGVRIDAKVLTGIPFIEITRQVLKYKYDLVMKTAAGATGTRAMLFGSTALHLMRKCPCPVWIIKPIKHKHYHRILAAVDPDTWNATKAGLNRMIMELATSMAMRENSELHVVLAWNPYLENILPDNTAPQGNGQKPVEPEIQKRLMSELLARYGVKGLKLKTHLIEGNPEDVILSVAREERIELIVMGTIGRVGLPGLFIGSTAEDVLRQIDCSVLTVKPDGFVTPVTI
ncbi:MAG: universal stress protein [Sedimenticolaceae bacterium]